MFKKLAIAAIAVWLIAGATLAQDVVEEWYCSVPQLIVCPDESDCPPPPPQSVVMCALYDDGTFRISGSGELGQYPVACLQGLGCAMVGPWFEDRALITNIIIGDSVTHIPTDAFGECRNLKSVTIGSGVTYIGQSAFFTYGLTSVVILGEEPPELGRYAFSGLNSSVCLYVPDESIENYIGWRTFEGWNDEYDGFGCIKGISEYNTSVRYSHRPAAQPRNANARVTVRNNTLTIRPSSPESLSRIRLIDMRGKSVASFTARGNDNFSLMGIPAGRYFVEMRDGVGRVERGSVVVGGRR